jgi:hypothetical protein
VSLDRRIHVHRQGLVHAVGLIHTRIRIIVVHTVARLLEDEQGGDRDQDRIVEDLEVEVDGEEVGTEDEVTVDRLLLIGEDGGVRNPGLIHPKEDEEVSLDQDRDLRVNLEFHHLLHLLLR